MTRHKPIVLFLLIIGMLISCSTPSGDDSGTDNARAVKECVLADISTDTASYIREFHAQIAALPVKNDSDCSELYNAVNRLSFDMHLRAQDPRATVLLGKVLAVLKDSPHRTLSDTRQLLNTYVRLGATFADMGMPALGVDYYMAGLDLCRDPRLDEYKAMMFNNLGIIYAQSEILDKAEDYFNQSLDINLRLKRHHETFLNFGNLSELYSLRGLTEKALDASQQSLDYIDQKKHPEQLARMRIQQGSLYIALNQPDMAISRFQSALKQYRELADCRGTVDAELHISDYFCRAGQPDSALAYATRAFDLCSRHERNEDMVTTLKNLSDIAAAKGDYRQALTLMCRSTELSDSLRNAESRLRLTNWSGIGDSLHAVDRTHSDTFPLWAKITTALSILACMALAGLALSLRKRMRRNAAESQRQRHEAEIAVDRLNREMTSLSLEKLKMHEALADINDSLRSVLTELSPREKEKRDKLRELLGRVNNMSATDTDEEFKMFFERLHPDFYRNLSEKFPELTPRDLRLCAFLYLGMTTKEIAVLTYREVRSVDSARNRLRKKLNLDNSADLTSYIRSIDPSHNHAQPQ